MEMKLNIGASITLFDTLNKILYENSKDVDPPKERELPFNLRYKLQRALALVEKDYLYFNEERNKIIDEIGVLDESKNVKRVPDDKISEFRSRITDILKIQVTHEFYKLKPEDLEVIDITNVSMNEMNIFVMFLVDDKEFLSTVNSLNPEANIEVETT